MDEEPLREFANKMIESAKYFGMNFEPPQLVQVYLLQDLDDVKMFFDDLFLERKFYDLVFLGIPNGMRSCCSFNL